MNDCRHVKRQGRTPIDNSQSQAAIDTSDQAIQQMDQNLFQMDETVDQ